MQKTAMPFSPFYVGFNSADDMRALRAIAGLTQSGLAALAGVHRQTVAYHEAREGRIDGIAPRMLREAIEAQGHHVPAYGEAPAKIPTAPIKRHCGAKTPTGPCHNAPGKTGRCDLHGNLSTGPKSAEGRERIAEAQRRRHASRGVSGDTISGHRKKTDETPSNGHEQQSAVKNSQLISKNVEVRHG
ncbi:MAG: hypothetical protein Devi2KO_40340 [Devosia indica]